MRKPRPNIFYPSLAIELIDAIEYEFCPSYYWRAYIPELPEIKAEVPVSWEAMDKESDEAKAARAECKELIRDALGQWVERSTSEGRIHEFEQHISTAKARAIAKRLRGRRPREL